MVKRRHWDAHNWNVFLFMKKELHTFWLSYNRKPRAVFPIHVHTFMAIKVPTYDWNLNSRKLWKHSHTRSRTYNLPTLLPFFFVDMHTNRIKFVKLIRTCLKQQQEPENNIYFIRNWTHESRNILWKSLPLCCFPFPLQLYFPAYFRLAQTFEQYDFKSIQMNNRIGHHISYSDKYVNVWLLTGIIGLFDFEIIHQIHQPCGRLN